MNFEFENCYYLKKRELLGNSRPFHEVLKPTLLDQCKTFDSQFKGITDINFEYDEFESARSQLINNLEAYEYSENGCRINRYLLILKIRYRKQTLHWAFFCDNYLGYGYHHAY